MLNMALTTEEGKAGAHKSIYAGFIKKVVKAIMDYNPNCIWIAWGKDAQKIKKFTGERAILLEAGHPSPLSSKSFFGCNHFNQINEILIKQRKAPINWNLE
jgi:uracil-DNA glycosylase